MEIREAKLSDLKHIQRLNFEGIKYEKQFDSSLDEDFPFSDIGKNFFETRIKEKSGVIFILLEEKNIIGYLCGSLKDAEVYRNVSILGELESIFISDGYRDKKGGSNLFQTFLDWLKNKKAQKIKVVASHSNIQAINFYKKHNFQEYDITLEYNLS